MGAGRGRVGEEVADVVAVDEEGAPVDERGGGVDEGGGGVVVKEEGVPPHHLQLHRRRRSEKVKAEIWDVWGRWGLGLGIPHTHINLLPPFYSTFLFYFRGKKCFFYIFPPNF